MVSLLLTTFLLPFALGHFQILSPTPRGYDEDTLGTFPCGGQNSVSKNRTLWPLKGGPIQLNMEHDRVAAQVLLGLGNDPGSAFNIVLQKTFEEEGIGRFCFGDVVVPESLNIKDGDNATIQVVTDNEDGGGLYNCADITFTSKQIESPQCTNGTGVGAVAYTGSATNANGTSSGGGTSTTSAVPGTSTTGSSTSGTAAVNVHLGQIGWAAAGALGFAVLLLL